MTHVTSGYYETMMCTFPAEIKKDIVIFTLYSFGTFSGGSQPPCHEDTQEVLCRGPHDKKLMPLPTTRTNFPGVWVTQHRSESPDPVKTLSNYRAGWHLDSDLVGDPQTEPPQWTIMDPCLQILWGITISSCFKPLLCVCIICYTAVDNAKGEDVFKGMSVTVNHGT